MRNWLILFCVAVTGCSSMSGPTVPHMSTRGYAFAPEAFYRFCEREPGLCNTRGDVETMTLDTRRRAELAEVNRHVNRSVAQRADRGARDRWGLPKGGMGDCEDLAILKKAQLIERGWPASTLLLAVATDRDQGHAVLVARTNRGDLILDNLTDRVLPWSHTRYRYFARQRPGADGADWEQVKPGRRA